MPRDKITLIVTNMTKGGGKMSLQGVVDGFSLVALEITHVVAIMLWFIVGFVSWIPFLARKIASFMGTILVATFTGYDPTAARVGLERAVRFYPDGFTFIEKNIAAIRNKRFESKGVFRALGFPRIWDVFREFIWAAFFWLSVGYFVFPSHYMKAFLALSTLAEK